MTFAPDWKYGEWGTDAYHACILRNTLATQTSFFSFIHFFAVQQEFGAPTMPKNKGKKSIDVSL